MKKLTCSLVLLALLGVGWVTDATSAGTITVYFNAAGTQRTKDSPGIGQFQTVWIYGEGFDGEFITGAQYGIDYGPHFTWVSDMLPGPCICPPPVGPVRGYSIGFGINIKPGAKFLIHRSILIWNSDCTTPGALNADGPVVLPHPHFPNPTPIVTRFPDHAILSAEGRRSQVCQLVEMDISPAFCPNNLSAKVWDLIGTPHSWKAGIMAVAVLGSSSVNVNDIDRSSIRLEGVAPLSWPQTTWFDVASTDGDNDCACDEVPVPADDDDDDDEDNESMNGLINFDPDGKKDLLIFFRRVDIAAAIGPTAPPTGMEVTLDLTGTYNDGLPFTSKDCVVITEGHHRRDKDDQGDNNNTVGAGLGLPNPNPFNPVTRIGYNVPSTQHVRIAIYDVAGRLVENLVNEVKAPGEYVVEWDAGNLPSGVYFYRMQTGSETIVRRATLLK